MRWGIERRLAFIDFRLYWEGRINRKDLKDFFGISVPQASADLKKYQETAPKNVQYDKSGKFYFATPRFRPAFISPDSSDYLSQLRLISEGILKDGESFLGSTPRFDVVVNPARSIEPETLRQLLRAIKEKMSLEIEYQSMSRPQPIWRRIVPHTLAYDGFRWHVRAYCYIRKTFRDFLLARVLNIRDPKPDEVDSSADIRWHDFLNVKIVPHPGLSMAQQRTIQRDYGMRNGSRTIRVRAALYFYFERQLGLDEGCELRPPHVQQIVLANRNEILNRLARYTDEKE
jgi:hypothetical protein